MYFELIIAYRKWEWNYPHHIFFWIENCYLLTCSWAHILSNLKYFQRSNENILMWRHISCWSDHISAFPGGNLAFTFFVRFQTLVLLFLCFSAFCEFQCHFYDNTFALTFIMGMFYFILVWWGLELKSFFFQIPGHIPDGRFPDQTHPQWTFPRPDTSPTDISPTRQMPDRYLPE